MHGPAQFAAKWRNSDISITRATASNAQFCAAAIQSRTCLCWVQSRKWPSPMPMSALPSPTDFGGPAAHVCNVPITEAGVSFDHLPGEREKRRRNREAELLRGIEIDDEFDSGRLDDGQLLRLFALENEPGVSADQTIDTGDT